MSREDNICWFHGKVTRERAEQILREEGTGDGVFLVRESNTSTGDYVLSVLHKGEVLHYQIRRHGEDAFFSIDDQAPIHGLDSLIEHYRTSSNGLITQLSGIVKHDPPPQESRCHGQSNLLHRATKEGNIMIVSALIRTRYKDHAIDAKNQNGQTAVHLACLNNHETILKELIESDANVNCRDSDGNTPLHYACRNQPVSLIRVLLQHKADIQARNNTTGFVPLHEAAKNGNLDAVKELLKHNAPHLPRTTDGELPIHFAAEANHEEIVQYLENYKPPTPFVYEHQWYHGTLNRIESNEILRQYAESLVNGDDKQKSLKDNNNNNNNNEINHKRDHENNDLSSSDDDLSAGVFLIRFSKNSRDLVLTLLFEKIPRNFIIKKHMKYLYIDEGPYMPSLQHLIQHYMNFSDGLPVNLRFPVPPKPKPPLPLFITIPQKKLNSTTATTDVKTPKSSHNTNDNQVYGSRSKNEEKLLNKKYSYDGNTSTDDLKFTESESPASQQLLSIKNNDFKSMQCSSTTTFVRSTYARQPASSIHTSTTLTTHKPSDTKKNSKEKSNEILKFHSLKLPSPKKNILDGMKSLKKNKLKSKAKNNIPPSSDILTNQDKKLLKNIPPPPPAATESATVEISSNLKNISFSTEFHIKPDVFANSAAPIDSVYNIPTNNCAINQNDADKLNNNQTTNNDDDHDHDNDNVTNNSINDDNKNENNCVPLTGIKTITDKNYFIESDHMNGADKDHAIEEIYFIDAPKILKPSDDIHQLNTKNTTTDIQYTPFKDVTYFPDVLMITNNNVNTQTSQNAQLQKEQERFERLDSTMSMISTDSYYLFNRQVSAVNKEKDEKPNYFIPSSLLSKIEVLGGGEFGSVYRGVYECPSQNFRIPVAVKTLHDEHCKQNRQEFLREASLMLTLSHHCIVKLIGISKGPPLMMVQELVALGSMLDYIQSHSEKIKANFELKIWASQIACGMNYLESHHFVHRDLAARNILIASNNQAKISDFGLSRALCVGNDYYQASQGGKWPIKWYAPESFNYGTFSHASDVWSFGVTLWEMFSMGQSPYGDMKGVDVIKLIEDGKRLDQPSLCPKNVFAIMENCWNYMARDRPTFRVLTDFFSSGPDYQNLIELIHTQTIN